MKTVLRTFVPTAKKKNKKTKVTIKQNLEHLKMVN